MKYKKYILIFLISLFIGCNNAYAADTVCYYKTSDNMTLVQYNANKNKVTIEQRNLEKIDSLNGEKIINYGKNFNDKKETGLTIQSVQKKQCPEYIVYRHKYRAIIIDSEGTFGFNNKTDAMEFYNASGKIEKMESWVLSKTTESQYKDVMTNPPIVNTNDPNYSFNTGGDKLEVNCDTLLGDKNDPKSIRYLANDILQYPRIIVPILVIVFGMLDFGQAVIAGKADEMKKAQTTFIMRVIAGVGFFFIPWIVDVLMELAEIVWKGLGYSNCSL